jgi:acyl carrier protein
MTKEEIFTRSKQIVIERSGIDESKIVENASLRNDLGLDSLDIVELIMELEDEFEIEIPDEEADNLKTVGDVIHFIESTRVNA